MVAIQNVFRALTIVGCMLHAALGSSAVAQKAGATVSIDSPVAEDQYLAGGTVTIRTQAAGDVTAAGGKILVDGQVGGDVNAAGGAIDLLGRVLDDARLAGGVLTVGAKLGGDLVAAGGSISLLRNSEVSGRAWLGGGRIEVLGRIGRELRAAGGEVVIDGVVNGNVHVIGRQVRIGSAAQISGDFTYTSRHDAIIDAGARIDGTVKRLPPSKMAGPPVAVVFGLVGALWLVGLIAMGIALVVVFPVATARLTETIQENSGRCALVGFAIFAAVPLAALISFMTLIGVPLGLALVALYFTALLAAYLTGALWLGERALSWLGGGRSQRRWWRAGFLAITLILLALIGWVPIVGWLVILAIVVLGLGGLGLQLHRLARA
jgi:cytoskeletal protein CcmA (bactofilin family)